MIEICPAGPPKLMKPSLSQNRKASRRLIVRGGGTACPVIGEGIGLKRKFLAQISFEPVTVATRERVG
jgi:hypothetical protein